MTSSILTNASAMTALRVLNSINKDLSTTQNRISTGLKVATAKDNASFWAVSTTMQSDVNSFKAISDNLSLAENSLSVARTGAEQISKLIDTVKEKTTAAQEGSIDKNKLQADIDASLDQISEIVKSANFNGVKLLETTSKVKLLSSIGRSAGGVDASYISFRAQDLSYEPGGGLSNIKDLSVLDRGESLLKNERDGVPVTQMGGMTGSLEKGDELSFKYTDAEGFSRTFTYEVKNDYPGSPPSDDQALALVDELNNDADFADLFEISYEVGGGGSFGLSKADRDLPIEVTGWSGDAFPAIPKEYTYGALTLGGTTTGDGDADIAFDLQLKDGTTLSIGLAGDGADVGGDDSITNVQGMINQALTNAGRADLIGDVTIDTSVTSADGEPFVITTSGEVLSFSNLEFGAGTGSALQIGGTADPADVTPSVAKTQQSTLEIKDEPLRVGEEIALNYVVNGLQKEVVFRATGNETGTGVALDDQDNPNRIVLSLDARLVADKTATGAIIAEEIGKALATLSPTPTGTGENTGHVFVTSTGGTSTISEDAAATGVNVNFQQNGNILSLTTDTNTAADKLLTVSTPRTDYDALLDNIEEALQVAVDSAAALGSAQGRIEIQKDFIMELTDNLEEGIGTLVDANMNEESARLQALQVQQQLGIQALSIANQAPQQLLSLFQ